MGAEKFMHIKATSSGKSPDCVVMNVTVRSMKLHGGAFGDRASRRPSKEEIEKEDVAAVKAGAESNLDRHIRNMAEFGMPVVVPVNRFASDTDAELNCIIECARASGASEVCLTEVHAKRWPWRGCTGKGSGVSMPRSHRCRSSIHAIIQQ